MKLSEAKQIVGTILDWQFVLMGIKERSDIKPGLDLSNYSLDDLMKANKIVKANNKRKDKRAERRLHNGQKLRGHKVSLLLADRLIAAAYTAMNFRPTGEMIAIINDVGVGCVRVNYEEKTDE